MSKLFLSLDDAVEVVVREFDTDPTIARQELEQKCYISDDQYDIGYYDGLYDSIDAINELIERENRNDD